MTDTVGCDNRCDNHPVQHRRDAKLAHALPPRLRDIGATFLPAGPPFGGTFDKKAAPKSDLSIGELVAVQLSTLIPRQGLEPRRRAERARSMRATRSERTGERGSAAPVNLLIKRMLDQNASWSNQRK